MPSEIYPGVLSWSSVMEDGVQQQSQRLARLPFVEKPVALMADAHVGMGCTVGTVVATNGAIIPAAIGVDIGCGMAAVQLMIDGRPLTSHDLPDDLQPLHTMIAKAVPSGVGAGHEIGTGRAGKSIVDKHVSTAAWEYIRNAEKKALTQLGSLGSGNHFIEISLDENDRIWVVLHSGSRGIGNQLAQFHIKNAQWQMTSNDINLEDRDLAFLTENTTSFEEYIADMLWAQDYALANRETMMLAVRKTLTQFLDHTLTVSHNIQCHHNFTQQEKWHGKDLWITRKGAIQAQQGQLGIIPGSMGTSTYIVSGEGNPLSYNSSSHGAGRVMSRTKARKELDVATLEEAMKGKAWNKSRAASLIDEDPRSYKDIDQVMLDQSDLTTPVNKLNAILNYKGA